MIMEDEEKCKALVRGTRQETKAMLVRSICSRLTPPYTHTYGLTATAHTRDFVSIFIPVDEIERECVRGWLGEFVV